MRESARSAQTWRALLVATGLILHTSAPALSQSATYNNISFAEVLRGHARATVGLARLPDAAEGVALTEPGVVVTATPEGIFVEGARLVELDHGRVASEAVQLCRNRMPCLPEVRRDIERIRGDLAAAYETRPPVIIVADTDLPYATLHLLVSTSAEAGAALSILITARTPDGELTGVPVWITPSSEIYLGRSQEPALATVSVNGPATAVSATSLYMEQASWASNIADMKELLGRIELRSGRTTCFVTASNDTRTGQVIRVITAIREVFPHIVLSDERGLRISGR